MTLPDYARGQSLTQRMTGAFAKRAPGLKPTVRSAQYVYSDSNGVKVYKLAVYDPSSKQVRYVTYGWDGSNLLDPGKPKETRSLPEGYQGSGSSAGERSGNASLDAAKERWHRTVLDATLSAVQKRQLTKTIDNFQGDVASLNQRMAQLIKPTYGTVTAEAVGGDEGFIDPFAGIDFGGGGGGGFAGPTYRAPDRRVVEDFVTGALVSLVGNVPSEEQVDGMVDLYMTDHRRNFDSQDAEIDPSQSVHKAIRNSEEYQTIHALRPESEDDRAWVAQRRQAAAQGGLTTGSQEDFAITQATVGGDLPDVAQAASVAQLQGSGSARGTLLQGKIREVTQNMFTRVR